jgi:hypothetical protein
MHQLPVYRSSGPFPTELRRREDIVHTLQRLDELTTEDARMVAAEALNTFQGIDDKVMGVGHEVHGVHNTLKAFKAGMRGPQDTLQDVNEDVNDFGDNVTTSTNAISAGRLSLNLFRLGAEKPGRWIATEVFVVAPECSKAVHGVGDNGQVETLEHVRDRAMTIGKTQDTMEDITVRIVGGAQVLLNLSLPPH